MKMSLSTSKLSYPEPMREFFSAFKTTNPGQPSCGPAQLSAASGYESLIKSESDSGPDWVPGGGKPASHSQLRGGGALWAQAGPRLSQLRLPRGHLHVMPETPRLGPGRSVHQALRTDELLQALEQPGERSLVSPFQK